jgi:hypothetical protein
MIHALLFGHRIARTAHYPRHGRMTLGRCTGRVRLYGRVELEERIALVANTWSPHQQFHPGNIAWHGTGCDGAPAPDLTLAGESWFAEVRTTPEQDAEPDARPAADSARAEVYAHFSPRLDRLGRQRAWDEVRGIAAHGHITLASGSDMARTVHEVGAQELPGPYFLMQHRSLHRLPVPVVAGGYEIVRADIAGDDARVQAHRSAWAPARIKSMLGIRPTGNEPASSFSHAKYGVMKSVSIYRPELSTSSSLPPMAHRQRSRSGGSTKLPPACCSNPSERHPSMHDGDCRQPCARPS